MKEGHNEVFSELPQNSPAPKSETAGKSESTEVPESPKVSDLSEDARVKIAHDPHKKVENVDYSSEDILDSSMAGARPSYFVNVKEKKDISKDLKKAGENLQKAGEDASKKAKTGFAKIAAPVKKLFATKERREVTFSVIGASLVAICLLLAPAIFGVKTGSDDPLAINPKTGYTNRETQWNSFTNMVRSRVYELSEPDRTTPQIAVETYFEELLRDYRGIVQHIDIRCIEAEYYLNMGYGAEALAALQSVDISEYPKLDKTDADFQSHLGRLDNYYSMLTSAYMAIGEEAMADAAEEEYKSLVSPYYPEESIPEEEGKTEE